MIEIRASKIHAETQHLDQPADVFVRVTGTIALEADGRVLYREEDFPVVELAADLRQWISVDFEDSKDFEFDSMSTPEPGWVWIRRSDSGWRIGSLHQEAPDPVVRSDEEVRNAVERFVASVKAASQETLGVDVSRFVEQTGS